MKQIIFLLFLWLFLPTTLHALPFKEISTDNGLSNRRVFMSAKDNDGYIWFATRTGIDRYNGDSFVHYSLSETNNGFTEYPKGIFCNSTKDIYAFSEKNIYRYSPRIDGFIRIHSINISNQEAINTVTFDPMGHLWIGTTNHLYCMSKNDSILRPKKEKISVYSIVFENNRHGWIGTSKGLFHLTGLEDESYLPNKEKKLIELNDKRIQSLFFDKLTQCLWIGTFNQGIYRYNKTKKELDATNSSSHRLPVRSITNVGSDRIWVGIDGVGIYEYNRFEGNIINEYSQKKFGYSHIKANSIYHILDDENSVWICTYTGGVFVYNKSRLVTDIYRNIENNSQSLVNNHVNCILEDNKHRLWMGTNQGISRFDPSTGSWKHFLQDNTIQNAIVLSLFQDKEGNVWAGGYACDIVRIDRNDQIYTLEIPTQDPKRKRQQYAYAIYQDEKKDIWIGGIINNFIRYSPESKMIKQYPIKGINQILPFGKDTLLIASNGGTIIFNKQTGKTFFLKTAKESNLLKVNIQRLCIIPEHPNELWIGTEGRGVFKYNLKTNSSIQYTQANGLSSNSICGLQYDNQGRIWISTENGLNCLHPKHNYIETFYEPDGLPDNILNFRSHYLLHNGHIAWGTPSGAFELNPEEYSSKAESSYNLRFEEFALFNTPISPKEEGSPLKTVIDKTEHIILKHNQHSFSFRFLNLGYLNASKNMYSWYLEGFDRTWNTSTDHHHAVYTNIPSGEYIFHVKVFNGGNEHNYQERKIRIIILQPWWNTWMAWIVYILIASIITYYLIKAYKDRLEARDSDQKIRFFINLAHDIRTPLTLIKAPLNEIEEEPLTENGKSALTLAQRNIEKLLNMVTQLLDFQKIEREAMSLQVEETEINSFISSAVSNFEPLAREKGINLHLLLHPKEEYKGYVDQRKISIILDNLISNSIKYTCQHGNVWIKSCIENGALCIEITDDGIGISEPDQKKLFNRFYRAENAINSKETGSGIGLLLTKKMVFLHKGNINFSSTEGAGTSFYIQVPVMQYNYSKTELVKKEYSLTRNAQQIEDTKEEKKKEKLLIVEDNEELRSYLAHYLSRDYQIIESENGQSALEMVQKENPDFIVSDVMMPVLSGIDLCQQLKSNIETCHIPIILLTSLAEREDIIKGLNAGADDYITKPFDLSVLKKKIASIINNRHLFYKKHIDKSAFSSESTVINELDKKFMSQVIEYVEDKMMHEDFSIDALSIEMAMSRSVFFKKIKSLSGQSPQDFIRDIKMKRAATFLIEKKYSIGEIAYLTGYPNAKYFSTVFRKYYGKTPSDYISYNEDLSKE